MTVKQTVVLTLATVIAVFAIILLARHLTDNPFTIRGAVIRQDSDPRKQGPIADVEIALATGGGTGSGISDASGFFSIPIPVRQRIRLGEPLVLVFRHPEYQPLILREVDEDKLYVVRLQPVPRRAEPTTGGSEMKVANVVAKYSINSTTAVNVGSAVRTFEVVNTGDMACTGQPPCSPDGKWKAAAGGVVMDAGDGNEFHNVRASCIAGPCPFTRIEQSDPSHNRRTIHISAVTWSDTATFLVEAEVFRAIASDLSRKSYPVIFGRSLNFTMPADAGGVSIEAEMNGNMIVFPLGPELKLSWASCQLVVNKDQSRLFRCELKPGYRFP